MERESTGTWLEMNSGDESYKAFIPFPLPPDPPVSLDEKLSEMMEQALLSLGRLDSVTMLLPETTLFLYTYVRKEAVLSAQIEGTQSSLSDLLLFELEGTPGVPIDDIKEVSNYVKAMAHGLERLRGGFPLSLRLIREIHDILLARGRGADKQPGEFRRTQNWIGGVKPQDALYVPPPPDRVMQCMGDLELFLHDQPMKLPVLIKAALAHLQFESIHPFLDGNGRVGRLLITLILCEQEVLKDPMLYLSLYFKKHRDTYYELLQQVRTKGDWENWIEFFLMAVNETAEQAVKTVNILLELAEKDRKVIQNTGRSAGSALRVHQALLQRPVLSLPVAEELTGLVPNTLQNAMNKLIELGIVTEITGKKRGRLYSYTEYISHLNEGTI